MHKATINRSEEKTSLVLHIKEGEELEIELTEDRPNEVKSVFNKLISFLKKGSFKIELEDDKEDLYFHICTEYIGQLNTELSSIHQELEDYELLD
ncbi:MAG: hypothetical protein JXR07_01120 [Reichenbachiella sp.]